MAPKPMDISKTKSPIYTQKSPIYTNEPMISQSISQGPLNIDKRALSIYTKSPIYTQKNPIYTKEPMISLWVGYVQ